MEYNRRGSQCQQFATRRRLITTAGAAGGLGIAGCAAFGQGTQDAPGPLSRQRELPDWIPADQLAPIIERVSGLTGQPADLLRGHFSEAELQTRALELTRPLPRDPAVRARRSWAKTRAQQTHPVLLRAGLRFVEDNATALRRAEDQFGVNASILAAIIGVETRFGDIQGSFPTLATLATLGFQGHRRREYFLGEMEALLLLAVETRRPVETFVGSFAGALGMPQFMPSNYRRLAVDFDGDGQIDLFRSAADAIGSVGNFLVNHGWTPGEALRWPVSERAALVSERAPYVVTRLEAEHRFADLQQAGLLKMPLPRGRPEPADPDAPASLIELPEGNSAPVVWAVGRNFFALTQYNRSYLYAAGVIALAEALG